jgi:hypothetical protein
MMLTRAASADVKPAFERFADVKSTNPRRLPVR